MMIKILANCVGTLLTHRPFRLRSYRLVKDEYEKEHGEKVPLESWLGDYPAWRRSMEPGRSPINDRAIWVVLGAQRYLSTVPLQGKKVFEYGMGGSTLYFLDRGCETVSIEHDKEWYELVRSKIGDNPRWTGYCVTSRPWQEGEKRDNRFASFYPGYEDCCFEDYVRTIERFPDKHFDVIMVDGRARAGAISLAQAKLADDGLLILDNSERKRYAEAQDALLQQGWEKRRFFGAGPYVWLEFYDTTIWSRPAKA